MRLAYLYVPPNATHHPTQPASNEIYLYVVLATNLLLLLFGANESQ